MDRDDPLAAISDAAVLLTPYTAHSNTQILVNQALLVTPPVQPVPHGPPVSAHSDWKSKDQPHLTNEICEPVGDLPEPTVASLAVETALPAQVINDETTTQQQLEVFDNDLSPTVGAAATVPILTADNPLDFEYVPPSRPVRRGGRRRVTTAVTPPKRRRKGDLLSEEEDFIEASTAIASCVTVPEGNVVTASVPAVCGTLLELHLARRQVVDSLFDVVDSMFFSPLPPGGVDELYFNWLTAGSSHCGKYGDVATNRPRGEASSLRRTMCIALKKASVQSANLIVGRSPAVNDRRASCVGNNLLVGGLAKLEKKEEVKSERDSRPRLMEVSEVIDAVVGKVVESLPGRRDFRMTHLDFLRSPAVKYSEASQWSPREIAIFQLSICLYGQDFTKISHCIGTKNGADSYSFYVETFKQTTRYSSFKFHKRQAAWYK